MKTGEKLSLCLLLLIVLLEVAKGSWDNQPYMVATSIR